MNVDELLRRADKLKSKSVKEQREWIVDALRCLLEQRSDEYFEVSGSYATRVKPFGGGGAHVTVPVELLGRSVLVVPMEDEV